MTNQTEEADVSIVDLAEAPSPQQIQAWILQAAMIGKRKIVKVNGETLMEIG